MISTDFLSRVGCVTRSSAPQFWSDKCTYCIRTRWEKGHSKAGLWFRTAGCTWSKKGSCLMCNYSSGPYTTSEQIVSYVRHGLQKLDEKLVYLLVSPSGSMLDPVEVPIEARDMIFNLLASQPHESFGFESRPETIHSQTIESIQKMLMGRLRNVLLGIETVNGDYQRFCLNKDVSLERCADAFRILSRYGVKPVANVLLGIPFLTEKESILTAVETISWALQAGADYCYLFPVHVKEGTPLHLLYQRGFFRPPSLWSMIEVMQNIQHKSFRGLIRPSWYTSLGAYNITKSPYTCDNCFGDIIGLLDHFDRWRDSAVLEELFNYMCICRERWRIDVNNSEDCKPPLSERVLNGYAALGDATNLEWAVWEIGIQREFLKYFST